MLNGKQMIATLNVLGLDYATLGNHEFDLKEASLRRRLDESRFQWISSNVFELNSSKPFQNILPYKIIVVDTVRILLIGLTIDDNLGPVSAEPYVNITSQSTLPHFTAEFIKHLRHDLRLKWDVLICLTHLNMQNDIEVVEHNLAIDVVMGGHEHENYFLKRGSKYTPIYKADDNAFTVFIHRFAYQPKTKQLLIFSKLTRVSSNFPDEPKTAEVANYYYQAGLQAYREQGNPASIDRL
jgi:5'-nucleotidase / UDP-sugar diphosphatase